MRRERDRLASILKKMKDNQREQEKIAKQECEEARDKSLKVDLSVGRTLAGYDYETELQMKLLELKIEVNK